MRDEGPPSGVHLAALRRVAASLSVTVAAVAVTFTTFALCTVEYGTIGHVLPKLHYRLSLLCMIMEDEKKQTVDIHLRNQD